MSQKCKNTSLSKGLSCILVYISVNWWDNCMAFAEIKLKTCKILLNYIASKKQNTNLSNV